MKNNILSKKSFFITLSAIFIILWIFLISPYLLKISDDFLYNADIVSVDNFYDEVSGEYKGERYSKTRFSYEVVSREKNVLFIKNIFEVKTLDNELIFKAEPVYAIDRFSGKHVYELGEKNRNGYLFAPRGLKKGQSFEYWHVSGDKTSNMKYVGEERLYGLKVYKYEKSNIETVDQTEFMSFLPGVPENKGVKLLSKLEMWVEPVSGYPVKIEDSSVDYYYYDIKTGEKLNPYNKFSNTYSEESLKKHISSAVFEKNKVLFIKFIPILFLIIVFTLFLFFNSLFFKKIKDFILNNKLNIVIFIISMAASVTSAVFVNAIIEDKNNKIFEDHALEMTRLITDRVRVYENSLYGARGLFDASDNVNRNKWKNYVNSLNLQYRYPGIQGLGYSKFVKPSEKDNFIKEVRDEGFTDFNIKPEGKRDTYTSIIFLEPFDKRNIRAFGFDMFSEEVRRKAMVRARDSAEISATGKVSLLQEDESDAQSGFLLYLSVYKNGIVPDAENERKENLLGYVYSPIRMNDFMKGVFGLNKYTLDLRIYNGLSVNYEKKMFDSVYGDKSLNKSSEDILFKKTYNIYIGGEPFTLEFINSEIYKLSIWDKFIPYIIFTLGLVLSTLIFLVIYSNTQGRKKALLNLEKNNLELKDNIKELGDTKKAIINILDDIQDEKTKLAQVSERLELATKSAKIGVWEWDIKNNSLTANDEFYKHYNASNKNFKKAKEGWLSYIHKDDLEKVQSELDNTLKHKDRLDIVSRVVLSKGEIKTFHFVGNIIRGKNTEPLKIIGVQTDISIESMIDKEKTEFVSLASHQLKTPIGSIQWDLEMLLAGDYGPVSDSQKEVLNEVYTMGKRMNDLVNALLNISRIEMGVFIIEPKPTNLIELCKEVIEEMKPRLLKKGHKVLKYFDDDLTQISVDDKLLRIIYQNFISNAIKYTQDNGKIKISIKATEKDFIFSVSNNGEPIPEADQSRIFTKMFRASNAQEQDSDGNGLGLYVVKQIVENAGGQIWFTSKTGEDTVFSCSFPLSGMIARSGTKVLT